MHAYNISHGTLRSHFQIIERNALVRQKVEVLLKQLLITLIMKYKCLSVTSLPVIPFPVQQNSFHFFQTYSLIAQ